MDNVFFSKSHHSRLLLLTLPGYHQMLLIDGENSIPSQIANIFDGLFARCIRDPLQDFYPV